MFTTWFHLCCFMVLIEKRHWRRCVQTDGHIQIYNNIYHCFLLEFLQFVSFMLLSHDRSELLPIVNNCAQPTKMAYLSLFPSFVHVVDHLCVGGCSFLKWNNDNLHICCCVLFKVRISIKKTRTKDLFYCMFAPLTVKTCMWPLTWADLHITTCWKTNTSRQKSRFHWKALTVNSDIGWLGIPQLRSSGCQLSSSLCTHLCLHRCRECLGSKHYS